VDKIATKPQRLAYTTIAGMINSLGDTGHSIFLTPDEMRQDNDFQKGEFEGVGIKAEAKNGQVVVVASMDGSPAQEAGLRSGDVIMKVDGQPVTSVSQAARLILGAPQGLR